MWLNFMLIIQTFENEEQMWIKLIFADMIIYFITFTSDTGIRVDCIKLYLRDVSNPLTLPEEIPNILSINRDYKKYKK